LAPAGLRVGATVVSATDGAAVSVAIQPGNCLSLRALPTGVLVHNLEIQ
jgi:ribosomal protein L2